MDGNIELPFHPTTGLQAIGSGRRGWIWPVMGGAEEGAAGEQSTEGEQEQGKAGGKSEFEQLPVDHPLVKRLETLKAENKDLKPKAKKLTELEEAAKPEAERTANKIASLETEVASVPAKIAAGLREHLVALHEIDKDDAELFLTGDTPELLLKQVTRLLDQSGTGGSKRKNYVSKEGTPQRKPAENENAKFASSLFAGSDD